MMKEKGFTLIELLVVISIIVILVALVLPQFGQFTEKENLRTAAEELQTAIRTAQNNAISGVKCSPDTDNPKNWYVELPNTNSYSIKQTCVSSSTGLDVSSSIKTVNLSKVSIASITCSSGSSITFSAVSPVKFIFKNISGAVNFSHGDPSNCLVTSSLKALTIRLQSIANTSITKDIIIETGGSVYVKSN